MIARYTRDELGRLWTDQARMESWRRVEVAACEEMPELLTNASGIAAPGGGPSGTDLEAIRGASFSVDEVNERERVTDHDVAAFVDVLGASAGHAGRWIHFGLTSSDVLDTVLARLGLAREDVSTQVVARDRHAELLSAIALAGAGLERLATEVRHLQRTEVRELQEPFRQGQKGSSAMPHKRNPIKAEQISGLARVLRANAQAALENVALWHERDISHSSVERVILPDSTILLDYLQHRAIALVEGMTVDAERMRENLELTHGALFSQRVLLALIGQGMERDEAYRVVQELAQRAWDESIALRELLAADERVTALSLDLDEIFSYEHYVRYAKEIVGRLDARLARIGEID